MRYHWTTPEITIVRENYPKGGVESCLPLLERTWSSIYQVARKLDLRAPGETGVRERWPHTPEIDEQIRRLHETALLKGAILEFARKVGRPQWYVSKRARELGLKTPRFKEPVWSSDELDLLHKTAHISTGAARKHFLRAGLDRSETSIHVKRKRVGISVRMARQDAGIYNAHVVGDFLGVDAKTVIRWIGANELKARKELDLWLVTEHHLREFIIRYPLRVALRRIPDSNRIWFIGLLAGRTGEAAAA